MTRRYVTARRAASARWGWLALTLSYAVARIAFAGAFLADYGLDLRIFAVVELSSSALLGTASGRLVEDLVQGRRGRRVRSAVLTAVGYAAPDAYVLATVGTLPDGLLRTVVGIIVVSLVLAVITLVREVRRGRAAGAAAGQRT